MLPALMPGARSFVVAHRPKTAPTAPRTAMAEAFTATDKPSTGVNDAQVADSIFEPRTDWETGRGRERKERRERLGSAFSFGSVPGSECTSGCESEIAAVAAAEPELTEEQKDQLLRSKSHYRLPISGYDPALAAAGDEYAALHEDEKMLAQLGAESCSNFFAEEQQAAENTSRPSREPDSEDDLSAAVEDDSIYKTAEQRIYEGVIGAEQMPTTGILIDVKEANQQRVPTPASRESSPLVPPAPPPSASVTLPCHVVDTVSFALPFEIDRAVSLSEGMLEADSARHAQHQGLPPHDAGTLISRGTSLVGLGLELGFEIPAAFSVVDGSDTWRTVSETLGGTARQILGSRSASTTITSPVPLPMFQAAQSRPISPVCTAGLTSVTAVAAVTEELTSTGEAQSAELSAADSALRSFLHYAEAQSHLTGSHPTTISVSRRIVPPLPIGLGRNPRLPPLNDSLLQRGPVSGTFSGEVCPAAAQVSTEFSTSSHGPTQAPERSPPSVSTPGSTTPESATPSSTTSARVQRLRAITESARVAFRGRRPGHGFYGASDLPVYGTREIEAAVQRRIGSDPVYLCLFKLIKRQMVVDVHELVSSFSKIVSSLNAKIHDIHGGVDVATRDIPNQAEILVASLGLIPTVDRSLLSIPVVTNFLEKIVALMAEPEAKLVASSFMGTPQNSFLIAFKRILQLS